MIFANIRHKTETTKAEINNTSVYLSAACKLAFRICRDAIWYDQRCNWIGQRHDHRGVGEPSLICANLDMSMYNGTAGIAYFLKALHTFFPDPLLRRTALGAINHALQQCEKVAKTHMHSFWTGHLGVALTALDLAHYFDDRSLQLKSSALIDTVVGEEVNDGGLDILDGCAGAITAVIKYKSAFDLPVPDRYLKMLAKNILSKSNLSPNGRSWISSNDDSTALLGYAHGTAGFAHALIECGAYLKNDSFTQAGLEAITYENSWFDAKARNWPDLRPVDDHKAEGKKKFMNAWCHGAMGIGLSRLRCFELTADGSLMPDIQHSLSHLTQSIDLRSNSACLCHGWAGNADLAFYASEVLDMPELNDLVRQWADDAIDTYIEKGQPWINGLQNHGQTPGLMDGSAGLGYFFLRLHDRISTPSILLMSPT